MNFSFMNRNRLFDHSFTVVGQQLMNIRLTLASLSQVVRVDLGAIHNDDPRQIPCEIDADQRCELENLRKYGGNKYFYEMVKGIANGELFPIDRPVYENTEVARRQREDYLSLLRFNVDRGDEGIYLYTLEGTKLIGSTSHNPFIVKEEREVNGVWPIVFNKSEPDEIKGNITIRLDTLGNGDELGFDAYFLSTGSRYVYSTNSQFEGVATLEPGHPPVWLGGLESRFIDQDAVNKIILGDDVVPSQDEVLSAAIYVLERFRMWMIGAKREDAEKAKQIFNKYRDRTLLSIEGYWSKPKDEEPLQTPEMTYSYRLATDNNLESYTQRRLSYHDRVIQLHHTGFNAPVPFDFLTPLRGPSEENPEYNKLNRAFTGVNLIRLVSGLEDFLKDPENYLAGIAIEVY